MLPLGMVKQGIGLWRGYTNLLWLFLRPGKKNMSGMAHTSLSLAWHWTTRSHIQHKASAQRHDLKRSPFSFLNLKASWVYAPARRLSRWPDCFLELQAGFWYLSFLNSPGRLWLTIFSHMKHATLNGEYSEWSAREIKSKYREGNSNWSQESSPGKEITTAKLDKGAHPISTQKYRQLYFLF